MATGVFLLFSFWIFVQWAYAIGEAYPNQWAFWIDDDLINIGQLLAQLF
jgi:hypothetical protein